MTTKTRRPSGAKVSPGHYHVVFYDIETVADPDLPAELSENIVGRIKVRETKDPAKDAQALEEKIEKAKEEFSLSPLTNRIVCIAYAIDDSKPVAVYGKDEKKLLEAFVSEINVKISAIQTEFPVAGRVVACTFNGSSFDQHVLFVKLVQHGLDVPLFPLRVPKFDRDNHIDLRSVLGNFDNFAKGTLGQWSARFGYDGAPLEHSGNEIAGLFREGRWDEIKEKCKADVELVRFMYGKLKRYL